MTGLTFPTTANIRARGFVSGGSSWFVELTTGLPTSAPTIVRNDASFGLRSNRFGFNVRSISVQTLVVEACTSLSNPVWLPLQTNTLTDGSAYFSDPQWTNHPGRFYRVRTP